MSNIRRIPAIAFLVLLLVTVALPSAARAADLAGRWEGTIELPGMQLAVDLDFTLTDGVWSGDITIPAQGAQDLPLQNIEVQDASATFGIQGVPGAPIFTGQFSEDGQTLAGTFTQSGGSFPFSLTRGEALAEQAAVTLATLGETIAATLADWQTPGLSLGVVHGGQVVLAEGYGLRDVEHDLPVTSETLFAIGSSTKAFTAFAMGLLVDDGLLEWDRPVREYLPEFGLWDEYAAGHITPRDLVTHRSGLPRHDLVWYGNKKFDRADLVAKLAYLEPNKELRQQWQYNNLMFTTAGYLVGQLRGSTWEEAVQAGIFLRLDMTRSNFSVDVSQADSDHARPYQLDDDELRQVDFRSLDAVGPAGSINSCADDMVRWLMANLGKPGVAGPAISPATLVELQAPQMVIPGMPRQAHRTPASYAMGWFIDTWRGRYRVQHGGNIDGFSAAVWLFPREGLGIVALSNRSGDAVPSLVAATVSDLLLDLEPMDHLGTAAARRDQALAMAEESSENKERFRETDTQPSRAIGGFAGRYEHPGYGVVEIVADAEALTMLYNDMEMPLRHWHHDVFSVEESDDAVIPEDLKVNFLGDAAGKLSRVEIDFEMMVDPIVFARMPAAKLSDPAYLARLTGKYELPPQVVTIRLQKDHLVADVPGQPSFVLEPKGEDEFGLEGMSGYGMKFTLEGDGPATEVIFIQPNGVFTAKRLAED